MNMMLFSRLVPFFAVLMTALPGYGGTAGPVADPVLAKPTTHDLYQPATFVHMVGRMYMLEEWVTKDLGGEVIDIVPIDYQGNPAFRVEFHDAEGVPRKAIVMANGGFELYDIKPVLVE